MPPACSSVLAASQIAISPPTNYSPPPRPPSASPSLHHGITSSLPSSPSSHPLLSHRSLSDRPARVAATAELLAPPRRVPCPPAPRLFETPLKCQLLVKEVKKSTGSLIRNHSPLRRW
ncbi:hypothetical protein U9M48_032747 [Paspalum notatum var. saurae]|uniref:Uncharacterized protein n=1 Tax=Paspalum notatum var. saurae TaxID=547442 RepID=A0AAQ3U5E0_PASNO